ncbi:hypothetical protein SE17_16685, partial [Kouleothrix aurantiaca]
MDDHAMLHRRLDALESLVNIADALRPDIPESELYELSLQSFCSLAGYDAGTLWRYNGGAYICAARYSLDRQRAALPPDQVLSDTDAQNLLALGTAVGGMHWLAYPLPAPAPAMLRVPGAEGHTMLVPLAFTERIGIVVIESTEPAPDPLAIELLGRLGDRVAVALDTARVFQTRQETINDLQRLMETQRVLQETVLELSAPLLPLLPGVLVLPLIGSIDAARADRILQAELGAIMRDRAQVVLVDITGTSVVDTHIAMQLI